MNDMVKYIINLIVFIPFILVLILITIKFSKFGVGGLGINKYVKVLERTSLSKDSEILVLKMGDEGCVLVSSSSNSYKIKELTEEEIEEIEKIYEENKKNSKLNPNNIKLVLKKLEEIKNERISPNNTK